MNRLCMDVLDVVVQFIPLVVFASMAKLMMSVGFDVLLSLGQVVLADVAGTVLVMLVAAMFVAAFGNMSFAAFLKDTAGFAPIPFALNSSNACLPQALAFCEEKFGIRKKLAMFTLPVGIQFNMNGTGFYIILVSVLMARTVGVALNADTLLSLLLSAFIVSFTLPGCPGASLIGLSSVFEAIGVPVGAVALFLCIDPIISMLSTVGNVTSNIASTLIAGKEYYLAYAPIESLGWSFGTLIERDVVVQPARDAKAYLLSRAADFSASLQDFFWDNLLRTAVLLLALLAALFFASRKAADRFVKPVLALTAGVREIAGGNLDKKIEVRTGDEIETLADSFNQMTGEMKSYIENLAKTTAEKERIETELSVAARIQAGILPRNFPARGAFDLFASMHPAKEVGGDFYDFYFLDERHLMVTVADVSDKGVPAALFMVAAKTLLKESALMMGPEDNLSVGAKAAHPAPAPTLSLPWLSVGAKAAHPAPAPTLSLPWLSEAVTRTNDRLAEANDEGMFVTAFTGVLDIRSGDFTYVNAGHNPPLLRRNGNFEFLPVAAGPMLGAMGGMAFPAERLTLSAGDMLFLYTDGVTEAMNEAKEMFTGERLKETLSDRAAGKSSAEALAAVREAVSVHAGGAEQSDDITMLGLVFQG